MSTVIFLSSSLECAVDKADLSYIPGVSITDFELEVAALKASNMWVNKLKSINIWKDLHDSEQS